MAISMYNTTRARLPLMVNLLLQYGAEYRGQGLLTWVIITLPENPIERDMLWSMHIMSELIRAGVDVNEIPPEYKDDCPQNAQEAPLIAAALSGSRSFVCFLLSHGADRSVRHEKSGRTVFECAYDAFPSPGDSKRRDQLVSIFAENGMSSTTLFGILDSEHKPKHLRYCRCSQRVLGPVVPPPEMRFQPVLKPEI